MTGYIVTIATKKSEGKRRMTIQPLPHQIPAIAALKQSTGFLLADDMGLGKTYTALLAAKEVGGSVLVACPAFLKQNWIASACKIGIEITVLSYAMLAKSVEFTPDILICDESHYIKSFKKAQRAKFSVQFAQLVRKRGGRVWLLSGTPQTRDVDDWYAQLLAIGRIPLSKKNKPWTLFGFKRAVMNQVPDRWSGSGYKFVGISETGKVVLDKMRHGYYIRRTKESVLTLPGKVYREEVVLKLTKKLVKALDQLEGLSLEGLKRSEHFMALRKELAILKAHKIGNGIAPEIKANPTNKVVIFTAHIKAAQTTHQLLSAQNVRAEIITGGHSADTRQKIVENFEKNETQVLVATIQSCGTGLNITASADVRFIDRTFSPAENAQAEDRCYRIGQTKKVVVTDYLSTHPLELRILELLRSKKELIDKVA